MIEKFLFLCRLSDKRIIQECIDLGLAENRQQVIRLALREYHKSVKRGRVA